MSPALSAAVWAAASLWAACFASAWKIGVTASAYVLLAIPTFVSIHRYSARGTRLFLVLAILASLPLRAVVGIVLDVIALGLTFAPSARAFFRDRAESRALGAAQ